MVRTQIQLTDEQYRALRALAASEGRSMADVIRLSVDRVLLEKGHVDREAVKRRARAAVGRFRSELGDLAAEHDRYVADAFGR